MLQAESQFVISRGIDCVSRDAHLTDNRHKRALLIPQARCAFRLSPVADYGEWRGRSGIPKAVPPSSTSPPSNAFENNVIADWRSGRLLGRKCVMRKSSNASPHHIVLRTVIQPTHGMADRGRFGNRTASSILTVCPTERP